MSFTLESSIIEFKLSYEYRYSYKNDIIGNMGGTQL